MTDDGLGGFIPRPLPTTNIVGPTPEPESHDPRLRKLHRHADALGACSSFLRLYADKLAKLAVGEYDVALIGATEPHGDHEAMLTVYVYGMESKQDVFVQAAEDEFGEFELRPYAGHDHYERRFDKVRLDDVELDLIVPVTLSLQIVTQPTQFPITRKDA